MSKKKKIIIVVIVLAAAAACALGIWYFITGGVFGGSRRDKVYVQKVSEIMSTNSGVQNRYSGVVESQETEEINKNDSREVQELYVSVGDNVDVGTPLFVYNTKEEENQLASEKLSLEESRNEISNYNSQISSLQRQMSAVSEDEKFNYITEIQSIQASIKETEFAIRSSETQIAELQKTIDEATVTSTLAGIVKTINEDGMDNYGNTAPYITILAVGDYRVKGTVNEQNIWSIEEGMQVIVHSRVHEDETWTGTITKIDRENPESSNSDYYYMDSSESNSSTKYPFYIALDSVENLMLGQHLYIEMDEGQMEEKEGIWLYSSYLVFDNGEGEITPDEIPLTPDTDMDMEGLLDGTGEPETMTDGTVDTPDTLDTLDTEGEPAVYVWADDGNHKLEKRAVVLGEYDAALDEYEIVSGLTEDDYITWPMDGLYEGVTTVTDEEEVDYDSPLYSSDMEGSYSDGEYVEDYDMDDEGMDMTDPGMDGDGADMADPGMDVEDYDIDGDGMDIDGEADGDSGLENGSGDSVTEPENEDEEGTVGSAAGHDAVMAG